MIKKIFILLIIGVYLLVTPLTASADHLTGGKECDPLDTINPRSHCEKGLSCQPSKDVPSKYYCQEDPFGENFGKIQPPAPLANFLKVDPTGRFALSQYLSNLIVLIYSIAFVVLIFMFLWGAFDWLISGGEKEKVQAARDKLTYAFIGILLFAVAFAVIQVLGGFTGFKFFVGQNI